LLSTVQLNQRTLIRSCLKAHAWSEVGHIVLSESLIGIVLPLSEGSRH